MTFENGCPSEVVRFVSAARRLISFCDQPTSVGSDLVAEAIAALSDVYVAALKLPEVAYRDAPDIPDELQVPAIDESLAPLPFHLYYLPLEPSNLDKSGSIAMGDVYDDFSDLYSDLKDGLWLFDNGHWQTAVWHWRLMFWHWSNHLIGALMALHMYSTEDKMGQGPRVPR